MTATAAQPPDDLPTRPARRFGPADYGIAAALVLVTAAVYARVYGFGFIYLDDQAYVAQNPFVRTGLTAAGVRYAFTSTIVNNWHPLTTLVALTSSTLFGPSAATFHGVNVVLHASTVGLLFGFLRTATGRAGAAAAAAALWGLHPLRVESVAWVAELKDVLCGACWVGCLWAYAAYARRRTAGRYATVAGLLVFALLSKPVAVTLPFVLLLCDYWPAGVGHRDARWWGRRLIEKVPLLALAAAAAAVAVRSQPVPAGLVSIPGRVRAGNAVLSILAYLRQTAWPTGLGVFYPHPWTLRRPLPPAHVAAAAAVLLGVTAAVVLLGRRRPYLPVGWFWFLGVLVPVLGLLQAGDQARADRFTYLPAIGLTVAVVYAVADAVPARVGAVVAVVAAVPLTVATLVLVPTWRSAATVWARADAVIPDNYLARTFLSMLALHDGDAPRAERLARQAVALVPRSTSDGHLALAKALAAEGRPADARPEFDAALRIAPDDPLLRYEAGRFLDAQHDGPAARDQLRRAVRLDPDLTAARLALARSLARDGFAAAAADQYQRLLAIDPANADARAELATVRPPDPSAPRSSR